jgi:KDO2-lipid IV(A) lauroyltransferase
MKNAPIRHRLELLPYLAVRSLILAMPHQAVRRFGRRLGRLGHALDQHHRELAMRNLAAAMPGLGEAERAGVVRRCYEHFGSAFAEAISAGRFTEDEVARRFDVEGLEHLETVQRAGRGGILFCGHLGSWQVAPYAISRLLGGFDVVARPPDNPFVARDVDRLRQRCGVRVLARTGAGHKVYRIVRQGGLVGMVIDQRVPRGTGIVVPFLGRPARTSPVPAFVALRNRAPVMASVCLPAPAGRYTLRFDAPLWAEGRGDEAVARLTAELMERIGIEIRRRPEMWLWMHDRWRM